jgi:glyoxylase-like metal-dependent hydrolase (beta-lactamase superfamily II)
MKKKRAIFTACVMAAWIFSVCPVSNGHESEKTVVRFSDRVYRITLDYGLRPNIGVSVGPDGILLVDTGHQEVAGELLAAVDELKKGVVRCIINTHRHGDHAGGNDICGENAVVIGFDDLEQKEFEGVIAKKGSLKKYYSMGFNGEEIRIFPSPGAHSDKDLIIQFTESGVVHMGDLLLTQSFPAVGPRVKEYLEILDWVIGEFPENTKYIGGHGRDYTLEDVKGYRKMLADTIEIVKKGMKEGKTTEQLKQEDVLRDYKSWGIFLEFLDTDYWIASICDSYTHE